MSWLDPYFIGISNILVNGIAATKERAFNLIAGSGVTITYADNPSSARTDVTITSTGGGGGTVPTGTGFYAIVAGVASAAARAVNLASSDIAGILAASNQAAQTMAGASVSGTTAAAVVLGVDGQPGGSAASATGATTYIKGSTQTGTTSTGGDTRVASGVGTLKSGSVYADIATSANATEPYFWVSRNLAGGGATNIAAIGHWPSGLANGFGLWLGNGAASPNNGNYAALDYAGTTELNGQYGVVFQYAGTVNLSVNSGNVALDVPLIGDAVSGPSPYGLHGQVVVALGAATTFTLTAVQYAMARIKFTGSASCVVTLPAVSSDAAAHADEYWNAGTGAITLSVAYSGGTATYALAAGAKARVWTEYTTGLS